MLSVLKRMNVKLFNQKYSIQSQYKYNKWKVNRGYHFVVRNENNKYQQLELSGAKFKLFYDFLKNCGIEIETNFHGTIFITNYIDFQKYSIETFLKDNEHYIDKLLHE